MAEVLCMLAFVLACGLVGMKKDIVLLRADIGSKVGYLRDVSQRFAGSDMLRNLHDGLFAHTINKQVGFGIKQDGGFEGI